MARPFLVLVFLIAVVGGLIMVNPGCGVYRVDKTVEIGHQDIKVEVAGTPSERAEGLSGRRCIGKNQAMLFEFDKPGKYPFWMKDMKFPIDIIWLNTDHKIVTIKSSVESNTYPKKFSNDQPAQYVLELKAGQAGRLGLENSLSINF